MTYTFCESTHASPYSLWHLRELDGPRRLGGGVTRPLCGREWINGWDLDVELTPHHLENNCCPECLRIYREG